MCCIYREFELVDFFLRIVKQFYCPKINMFTSIRQFLQKRIFCFPSNIHIYHAGSEEIILKIQFYRGDRRQLEIYSPIKINSYSHFGCILLHKKLKNYFYKIWKNFSCTESLILLKASLISLLF